MTAFLLGVVQLAAPKGTLPHRTLGWLWICLMLSVAVSSFWIHQIRLVGPWSPIHLLSIFTLVVLPIGAWMAHRHRVADHRRIMILIFSGALVIAGLFTFVPGADHAHVAVRPIATRQELSRPAIWASEAALENSFQEQGSPAAAKAAADPVSLWKNEGKNRSRHPLRGGFEALDALYDSHLKLTGFPLCLTLKIPSPESRRGPRIFVPYPSSTR